jgi:3-mercaptopropionate dioxygenase
MNAPDARLPDERLLPLRRFVIDFAALFDSTPDDAALLERGSDLLQRLISRDDWLPEDCAVPDPSKYQQYLLHCDSSERFSVVSFVWAPGQTTPIHDHTVWGIVGVLRGEELVEHFFREADATLIGMPATPLVAGQVESFAPATGDIHKVSNGLADAPSISIHVYGGNIGTVKRHTYRLDGSSSPFVSGYANRALPNIWEG